MISINYFYKDYRINFQIFLMFVVGTSPTLLSYVETFYFNKKKGLVDGQI